MSSVKKGLFWGVLFAFLVMGFVAVQRAMPPQKEDRIYKAVKVYSPYTFEERIGGLTIVDKRDGTKEKPSAADVLLRMDELDKKWGHAHLKIDKDELFVLGDNNQSVATIFIENQKEKKWLKNFFGI
jgi:hypothetical protein